MRRLVGLMVLASLTVTAPRADAQAMRRRVAAGEVTGLEMAIDGSLRVAPGGRARWFVTLYEVVRRQDLRPAPGVRLTVTSSHARGAPITTATTDAHGRAALTLEVPDDLEHAPHVRVEAVSPRRVRRVFTVDLELEPRYRIELFTDRARVAPGGSVGAFGRVIDVASGLPAPGVALTLAAVQGGARGAPIERTSAEGGLFVATLDVPRDTPGAIAIHASAEDAQSAQVGVEVGAATPPALWVEAEVVPPIARPGEATQISVRVRDLRGQPVAGARVALADRGDDRRAPPPRTDASGRVTLPWRAPTPSEPLASVARAFEVTHPAHGSVSHAVSLRVARDPWLVGFAVEGGALVPGLAGRLYARFVDPSGAPLAEREVTLESARLGRVLARTDADGVAVFEAPVGEREAGAECGGPTATEVFFVHGEHRARACLPLEPDATVALRADAPILVSGPVTFTLARRAAVARAPVEVTALVRAGDRWTPLARTRIDASASAGSLALPEAPHTVGELWLRARPILDGGRAALGGGVLVWRGSEPGALSLRADAAGAHAEGSLPSVAWLVEDGASPLRAILHERLGPAGARIDEGRTARFVAATLAARTPRDVAASVSIREGAIAAQPLPVAPLEHGLLRDPWRTRARFVRGRIGRLMRAVEDYVEARIPDSMDEVAVREGRGWRFNHEALEAAMSAGGIGAETAASLDGEPLDVDGLAALDAAFTYDHVARRITRARLFRVILWLRELVIARELDRPWARRGEVTDVLSSLLDADDVPWATEVPTREQLFDAWGQPFVLRRGRTRFTFLEPLEGWQVVSAGPDGRAGTGDDLADPFARVLPSGGLYAEAVGEDLLLARLNGVALGRATADSLATVFEVEVEDALFEEPPEHVASLEALPLPRVAPRSRGPLAPIARAIGGAMVASSRGGAVPLEVPAASQTIAWDAVPAERRAYEAIAVGFAPTGALRTAHARFDAGTPWAARMTLPIAMRPGEALRVPVGLIRLDDDAERAAPRISVQASAALEAAADGAAVVLRARRPGLSRVRVVVHAGEREVATFEETVRVVPAGSLRARHAGARAAPDAELVMETPAGALFWRAQVVIGAPRALASDPRFAESREAHPSIFAWAQAMRGDEVDPALRGATRIAAGADGQSAIEAACAIAVWATEEGSSHAPPALTRLTSTPPAALEERAAVLAALAAAVPGAPAAAAPLAQLLGSMRQDGWRALATASDRPAAMARMAAALLVVDRDDTPGRALLARAIARLETDAVGRRTVPGDPARAGDAWIGTVALAIAARQAGEDAIADELASVALGRAYLAARLGAEGVFWALAASAYGAFGVEGPASVELSIGGARRRVPLEDGVAVVPLERAARVTVSTEAPVWLRTERRFLVPWREASEGAAPRASIEGTEGRAGERAALEIVIANASDDAIGAPVIEIGLPGAARLDDEARRAIAASEAVRAVSAPDGAGVFRVALNEVPSGAERRIPLPIEWIASGETEGLALLTYDASTPWQRASVPPRRMVIEGERAPSASLERTGER